MHVAWFPRLCFQPKNKNPDSITAAGTKSFDSAVPPCIDTTSLSHPLFDCQHSQASYASITSSATCFLSPRPSGAHIIGFGSCRHHTVVDSLLVRFPFSSLQRFIDLISSYHRNFSLSTEFLAFFCAFIRRLFSYARFYIWTVLVCANRHMRINYIVFYTVF